MNYLMLSKKMRPFLHFLELPNEVPQTHGEKVYHTRKKFAQVINSPLMTNPWWSSRKKMNYLLLSKKVHPSLHFFELSNEVPQTHGKKYTGHKKICASYK